MTHQAGSLLTLETERFTLSSMCREDANDDFIEWMADEDVMVGMNMPRRRLTRVLAVRFVLNFDNHNKFCLAIKDKSNNQQIGFYIVDCNLVQQTAETSVVLGNKDYWGKNVVIETRTAILNFLFDQMNMYKVIGKPHGRNFSSIYNYKAMGFKCEAVLRQQMKAIQSDQRLDQLVFGMLRSEWREKQSTKQLEQQQ